MTERNIHTTKLLKKSSEIKHSGNKVAEKKSAKVNEKIQDKKTVKGNIKKTGDSKSSIPHLPKKNFALVNGRSLPISLKHAIALCNYIRGNLIDNAISKLDEVRKMKRAVPMRGEIPHKKGMMSGRYPVKAATVFIALLKSLRANALVNDMELEKYTLFCMANGAPRPYRRFGQHRFKRCHVQLKLVAIVNNKK